MIIKALGWFTALMLIAVSTTIFSGFALSVLWGWFVVGTFGAPALSIPNAFGLALIFKLMSPADTDTPQESDWKAALLKLVLVGFVRPGFALAVGWIVLQFM